MIRNRLLHAVCLTLLGILPLLSAGCRSETSAPPKVNGGAVTNGGAKEPPLPELKGEVELKVASWDELQAKIAEHKGKVVVLDLWSNWCDPCLKEFPNLITLQRKHADDVVCMSLNLNYGGGKDPAPTDENKKEALDFLIEKGAKIPNFISSVPDEELYPMIGVASVPSVFVYDREGKIAEKFEVDARFGGDFTYGKHVVPFVEKLLAEGKP